MLSLELPTVNLILYEGMSEADGEYFCQYQTLKCEHIDMLSWQYLTIKYMSRKDAVALFCPVLHSSVTCNHD